MDIAEMLVIRKVDNIIRFSSNRSFASFLYFNDNIIGWSLDDIKRKYSIIVISLKLIGSHLNYHVLDRHKITL